MLVFALLDVVAQAFSDHPDWEAMIASLPRRSLTGALRKGEKVRVLTLARDGLVETHPELNHGLGLAIKHAASSVLDPQHVNVSLLAGRDASGVLKVWLFASALSDPSKDPSQSVTLDGRTQAEMWQGVPEDWRRVGVPLYRRWTATSDGWADIIVSAPAPLQSEPVLPFPVLGLGWSTFAQDNLLDRLRQPDFTTAQLRALGQPA